MFANLMTEEYYEKKVVKESNFTRNSNNIAFVGSEKSFTKTVCFAGLTTWLGEDTVLYYLIFNGWHSKEAPVKIDNKAVLSTLMETFEDFFYVEIADETEHALLLAIEPIKAYNVYRTAVELFLFIVRLMDYEMIPHWRAKVYKEIDIIDTWQKLVYHYIYDVSYSTQHGFLNDTQAIHQIENKTIKRFTVLAFIRELEELIIKLNSVKFISTERWISQRLKTLYLAEEENA